MADIVYRLHGESSTTVCRLEPPTVPEVCRPCVFDKNGHWQVYVGSCFGHAYRCQITGWAGAVAVEPRRKARRNSLCIAEILSRVGRSVMTLRLTGSASVADPAILD